MHPFALLPLVLTALLAYFAMPQLHGRRFHPIYGAAALIGILLYYVFTVIVVAWLSPLW